ncbi:DUF937 domain-containing protein [Formosa sp. 4Alg 33]|uniref:DUF937 domain-containing protein n=1 Tax=Formosa sp. 4Alg 33 TaxID=3382189 RepID=UPI003D9C14AE
MDNDLLKSLNNYLTPDLITQASDTLGETEANVFKSITNAIPTLLMGMLNKTNDSTTMDLIMSLANSNDLDTSGVLLDLPRSLSSDRKKTTVEAGTTMLNLLFGNKQSSLFDILVNVTGVKKTSVSRIMLMTAPMILAYIRKSEYTTETLKQALLSQQDQIAKQAPSELPAFLKQSQHVKPEKKTRVRTHKRKKTEAPNTKWILPFLIFIASLLILYIMS